MAQPSVASFFTNRKRSALEDSKIIQARKVLILDCGDRLSQKGLEQDKEDVFTQVPQKSFGSQNEVTGGKCIKSEEIEEKSCIPNKIVTIAGRNTTAPAKKVLKATRNKKIKPVTNNKDIQVLLNNMNKPKTIVKSTEEVTLNDPTNHITPPNTPTKNNAMDKIMLQGPSLKEIKNKLSRSSRLAKLKASMARFNEGAEKLAETEKKTSQIAESPKIKKFRTIELEVNTSPQKLFSPEKAYLSPKKDLGVRRNLLNLLSPTRNAVPYAIQSPSKQILSETSKPSLTLPFKYRFLAELFRSIDTVTQMMYNRKETITFRKLKLAVEEMLKRNLLEKHLAQIKTIYPDAFTFTQEKLKIFGQGMRAEQWELVIKPQLEGVEQMTSNLLLERRRTLFNILLNKVKDYHHEFLSNLDSPIDIPKDKVTRWHPEFDIEKVPDIESSILPQPPSEDKLTSGKDVLDRARSLYNCNTRMEHALQKLQEAKETQTSVEVKETSSGIPESVLKGIPKSLLEKVRQKQAAKALVSMTRSADKEKELLVYSRLPEIARLTRNIFVSEKKGVLSLDVVVDKLGNCYRGNLSKSEMEEHLKVLSNSFPMWLVFHTIRNCIYIKLDKNADLSLVVNKLETLCKQKKEN